MTLSIYYDGDCYFCRNYAELVKLRSAVGDVKLVSLRDGSEEALAIIRQGYNVNTGFVVEHDGKVLKGADAYNYLAGIIKKDGLIARLVAATGKNPTLSKFAYPVLVMLRFVLLSLQGRALIDLDGERAKARDAESAGVRILRLTPLALSLLCLVGTITGKTLFVEEVSSWHTPFSLGLAGLFAVIYAILFIREKAATDLYWSLRGARVWHLIAWFVVWLLVVNTGELIIERRFLGFVAALPLMGLFLDLYFEQRRDGKLSGKKTSFLSAIYPAFLIAFVLFPGLYFPPFFGGIAGWTVDVDKTKPVRLSGIKFTNDQGETIWHNSAFLQPHTQIGRFRTAYLRQNIGDRKDYLRFVYDNYRRSYPLLERGRLPHQWLLGNFAYPTHNLTKSNADDYVPNFIPERIRKVEFVREEYDWDGNLVDRRVGRSIRISDPAEATD